jgi:hypothetical protein
MEDTLNPEKGAPTAALMVEDPAPSIHDPIILLEEPEPLVLIEEPLPLVLLQGLEPLVLLDEPEPFLLAKQAESIKMAADEKLPQPRPTRGQAGEEPAREAGAPASPAAVTNQVSMVGKPVLFIPDSQGLYEESPGVARTEEGASPRGGEAGEDNQLEDYQPDEEKTTSGLAYRLLEAVKKIFQSWTGSTGLEKRVGPTDQLSSGWTLARILLAANMATADKAAGK